MAQIVLSEVGGVLGKQLLGSGFSAFGYQVSGAAIGSAIGAYAGAQIDQALLGPQISGPRIESLRIMESREGVGIPSVYGRMRVGGQVIWASRFKEQRETRSGGGKGGPKIEEYRYSVSFAVALCEGEIARIGRVWANGELLDLSEVNWRLYEGRGDQMPDPLIEAIEGAGHAPAYRGAAYIVFEDLALDAFGNRLPQLSFEVIRRAPPLAETVPLPDLVQAVNIIPASGEFVYDTEVVRGRTYPAIHYQQNANSAAARADMLVSLDQLEAELPNVSAAALTVGWFGDDLRAGSCQIRPGVELEEKETLPRNWQAGGVSRGGAYQISRSESGHSNYGGTPSDAGVIASIQEMSARGIAVTLTPFLLMDVPEGNGLPDPYGGAEQAAFPWRGRIVASADKSAVTRAEVDAFLGAAQADDFYEDGDRLLYRGDEGDWGYRRFILHTAHLAKLAGGVKAFLIGSEMAALTRLRDETGVHPFVEGLIALAADVKQVLGAGTKVSYAADWTEYGAYVPGDSSGDVLFPLDTLWADANVDFVGVDWYPPMGDWRNGAEHLDAQAGFEGADDPAYLTSQIEGGEAYDWYYATESDRNAQVRTPIIDTAHSEHWVFRAKDIADWHASAHHERPGGSRNAQPTDWIAGSKPVRLTEIGFPALDKGANSPNLFYDPKSSESALPPYSNGARDDILQRRALEVSLAHWQASPIVEQAAVWCWDARPWPAFPALSDVWSDGPNYQYGHWLNGRVSIGDLSAIVTDICARGGVEVDASRLSGIVDGYVLDGVSSVRGALEPLRAAFGFIVIERGGQIVFEMQGGAAAKIGLHELTGDGAQLTHRLLDKVPGALRLTYVDAGGEYQPATLQAVNTSGDRSYTLDAQIPMLLTEGQAELLAEHLLAKAGGGDSAKIGVSVGRSEIEAGDLIHLEGRDPVWRVTDISDGLARALQLETFVPPMLGPRGAATGNAVKPSVFGPPELFVIDGPALPGEESDTRPLVAASAEPWPGVVRVSAGPDASALTERAVLTQRSSMGVLLGDVPAGPIGRWDRAGALEVYIPGADVASGTEAAVLAGANVLLAETESGWELLSFLTADLIGADTYRLTGLLRGQQGSDAVGLQEGARCVLLNGALGRADVSPAELGLELAWSASGRGQVSASQIYEHQARASLPWRPGHLHAVPVAGGIALSWTRRSADISDSWALPEPANTGRFSVELIGADGSIARQEVESAHWLYEGDISAVTMARVAQIGTDGRVGAAAMIAISPNLS